MGPHVGVWGTGRGRTTWMWVREVGYRCRLMGLCVYMRGRGGSERHWVLVPRPGSQDRAMYLVFYFHKESEGWVSTGPWQWRKYCLFPICLRLLHTLGPSTAPISKHSPPAIKPPSSAWGRPLEISPLPGFVAQPHSTCGPRPPLFPLAWFPHLLNRVPYSSPQAA